MPMPVTPITPSPLTTAPLLAVRDLCIHLPTPHGMVQAVRSVSFTLARGDTLGLVGESGSGKSLTALALLGLLPDNAQMSGSIQLNGQELIGQSDTTLCRIRGRRIAMVFQEPMSALNPVHPIGRQVAEPLRLHHGLSARAARTQALALLARVGISAQRIDQYPHQFSGGQRQRITIAMALAGQPDVLVADEPTTALDTTVQQHILTLIQDLVRERGMALLLVSHDLGLIARNADRMLVMYGGTVVEAGPTTAVFKALAHPNTRGLLAARPQLTAPPTQPNSPRPRLPTIPGNVPELHNIPPGCPFAGRCPHTQPPCHSTRPPLVNIGAADTTNTHTAHQARCLRLEDI